MYSVELYSRVRRACHVDGMSERGAARHFGIDRKTVSKILMHSVPPGYRRERTPVRPKLDPFVAIIDQILRDGTNGVFQPSAAQPKARKTMHGGSHVVARKPKGSGVSA